MQEELASRGIDESQALQRSASVPVVAERMLWRDSFIFPARLSRVQYLARFVVWFVAVLGALSLSSFFAPEHFLPFGLFAIVALGYRLFALDTPRIRDAGLSPALLLLYLVPFVNFVLVLALFVLPPQSAKRKAGQPGATDNPDDAQRLRKDH